MIYRARILTPVRLDAIQAWEDGALVVDGEGRIQDVGDFAAVESRHPGEPMLDLRPRWILPGLVDLHTHVPQYGAVARDGLELLPWLEQHIYPSEVRFADPEAARPLIRTFLTDLIRLGTTTSVLLSTVHVEATHVLFEEAEACGLRVVAGKVMMDWHSPVDLEEDTETSLAQSRELCETWHGRRHGRLHYAFTPRFAPSCTPELMRGTARLADKYGAYVHTHISENLEEVAWVRELFPEAAGYADVYRRMGLLGPRTLLAHGIHLGPSERQLILQAGATVVHCPCSNAFLKSGSLPLRRFLKEGIKVGLGTDVGAGVSLSMWREAGQACAVSKLRWAHQRLGQLRLEGLEPDLREAWARRLDLVPEEPITVEEAFWLATLGGADALGWADRIGSLSPGKEADFVVVEGRASDPLGLDEPFDPQAFLARLLYRPEPGMVRATFVRGQQCRMSMP